MRGLGGGRAPERQQLARGEQRQRGNKGQAAGCEADPCLRLQSLLHSTASAGGRRRRRRRSAAPPSAHLLRYGRPCARRRLPRARLGQPLGAEGAARRALRHFVHGGKAALAQLAPCAGGGESGSCPVSSAARRRAAAPGGRSAPDHALPQPQEALTQHIEVVKGGRGLRSRGPHHHAAGALRRGRPQGVAAELGGRGHRGCAHRSRGAGPSVRLLVPHRRWAGRAAAAAPGRSTSA